MLQTGEHTIILIGYLLKIPILRLNLTFPLVLAESHTIPDKQDFNFRNLYLLSYLNSISIYFFKFIDNFS